MIISYMDLPIISGEWIFFVDGFVTTMVKIL